MPTQMTSNKEKIFVSQETNYCDFCGELKPVERYYLRVKNKHFDDNKKGKYATYIRYCQQCGVEDSLLQSQKERVVEMCEKMKSHQEIDNGHDCYEKWCDYCINNIKDEALSDLKTKIEEEL